MTNKRLTPEEIEIIRQNPYVVSASSAKITYSLAFKKFAIEQSQNGISSPKIFQMAGFDPEILGKSRMYAAMKSFKREASSPEGLHEPRGKSREERLNAHAKEDLAKKHTKTAIRELQDRVNHLEQQIEFLKKIQSLRK
jgi:hypothetical protein